MYRRRSPRRGNCPLALCCMAFGLGVLLALCGELRTTEPFPHRYRILERDSHFRKEADGWYRVSRVYRRVIDRQTGQLLAEELVLDNHSRVMYDPALIPPDQIRQDL